MDADEFDRLRALADDAEDAQAAVAARREIEETGDLPVPWDEVKAELGLLSQTPRPPAAGRGAARGERGSVAGSSR